MQIKSEHPQAATAIRSDLGAIFVSLELSRSIWLITSLSPGNGETMSRHGVPAGDVAALLGRFADLRAKALARTGERFGVVWIHEAGVCGVLAHPGAGAEGVQS